MKTTPAQSHNILIAMSKAVDTNSMLDDASEEEISHFAIEFILDEVAKINSVKQESWISVEDRLPEPWTDVLVYPRPTNYVCEAQMGRSGCSIFWQYTEYEIGYGQVKLYANVTHWMPLPPPPKESTNHE